MVHVDDLTRPVVGPCWVQEKWKPGRGGYVQVWVKGRDGKRGDSLHVVVWESRNGKVPEGKMLDHLCRNRQCCNPDHLEPVTNQENVNRGLSAVRPTQCKRGHSLSDAYVTPAGKQQCRKCQRERNRQYMASPKAKALRKIREERAQLDKASQRTLRSVLVVEQEPGPTTRTAT